MTYENIINTTEIYFSTGSKSVNTTHDKTHYLILK